MCKMSPRKATYKSKFCTTLTKRQDGIKVINILMIFPCYVIKEPCDLSSLLISHVNISSVSWARSKGLLPALKNLFNIPV